MQKGKIVLAGPSAAGKTSILIQIEHNKFDYDTHTTINAAFLTKKVTYKGKQLTLNFWDTAGQERFNAISSSYFRNSQIILLCFDLTDRESFEKLQFWIS